MQAGRWTLTHGPNVISGLHKSSYDVSAGAGGYTARAVFDLFEKGWNICATEFRGRETPNEKVVGEGKGERARARSQKERPRQRETKKREEWTATIEKCRGEMRDDATSGRAIRLSPIKYRGSVQNISHTQSFPGIFLCRARWRPRRAWKQSAWTRKIARLPRRDAAPRRYRAG